jgi:hypothetical protein
VSELKRYKVGRIGTTETIDCVSYEDYTLIKAEAERYRLASLRTDIERLHAQFKLDLFNQTVAENKTLEAQVARLTLDVERLTNKKTNEPHKAE